jgi:hypothetical protein
MLLITVTRVPKGYRLLATSSYQVRYYCWSLYRNGALLAVISRSYQGVSSVNFDLHEPLAPGHYELRVECFGWPTMGGGDGDHKDEEFDYHTDVKPLMTIE